MDINLTSKLFLYLIVVISAVFHEYFHGWAAFRMGDSTAKDAGRLTLNPLKHMDPFGTVLIPLLLLFFAGGFIGWAKPVPYNPFNLRDRKYGSTKVALAGPLANFAIALIFGLAIRFLPITGSLREIFFEIGYINVFLAFFNLIPIPPLDGSKLLMDLMPRSQVLRFLEQSLVGMFIALALAMMFLPYLASWTYYFITGIL
ncbi:MAG: site-2 protease family protein [Candidatus Pacebacteria bacterium]|nr:site-2 protease family protein [Candidatus Paceibacterota bacterium]